MVNNVGISDRMRLMAKNSNDFGAQKCVHCNQIHCSRTCWEPIGTQFTFTERCNEILNVLKLIFICGTERFVH